MVLVDIAMSELLAAQLAFIRFVLAVDDLMSRHLIQTLEGAAADLTGVWSLLCPTKTLREMHSGEQGWCVK